MSKRNQDTSNQKRVKSSSFSSFFSDSLLHPLVDKFVFFVSKNYVVFLLVSLFILIFDQFLKRYFLSYGFVVKNKVMLYGITILSQNFTNYLVLLLYFTFLVLSLYFVFFYAVEKRKRFVHVSEELVAYFRFILLLIIVVTSNVIDRLQFGFVIDYLRFPFSPFDKWFNYFNLSDATISLTVAIFLLLFVLEFVLGFIRNSLKKFFEK